MEAFTEIWTVLNENNTEVWSSAANDFTQGAADDEARRVKGRLMRSQYLLFNVTQEANYGSRGILAERIEIRDLIRQAEEAMEPDEGSNDAERDALEGMTAYLRGLLKSLPVD